MAQENAIVVFEPQNIQQIAQMGPQAASENKVSHDRCIDAGQILLDTIEASGMNDEIDQRVATFIEKAKKTVKKINDKRMPVTKLFDTIRGHFTSLENDVDPSKKGSIPAQLQEHRNRYAAKKREEEEERRRAEAARLAKEAARTRYISEIEINYRQQFNTLMVSVVNQMVELDRNITLGNITQMEEQIKNISDKLSDGQFAQLRCGITTPLELTLEEARGIQQSVLARLRPQFEEQYTYEVQTNREDIIMRLPSKKVELERIAKANAEEAARIKAQMEERERAEAARKEKERLEREARERAEAELAAKKQQMDDLFGAASASVQGYQPKTQVKQRIEVLSPDGFMEILGMWWSQKGCTMSVEELSKEFKKQITFCNSLANDKDNPIFIKSAHIAYVEDIKAK